MARLLIAVLLLMSIGCSTWEPCVELEIQSVGEPSGQESMRFENARYRVLRKEPLTIEWEYLRCFDDPGQAGAQICARELQRGEVARVVCSQRDGLVLRIPQLGR